MSCLNFHDIATEIKKFLEGNTKQHAEDGMIRTMLVKRAYDDKGDVRRYRMYVIKYRTKFMGCSNTFHWFQDRPRCTRVMEEEMNKNRLKFGNYKDGKIKDSSSIFRQRG